MSVSTITQLVRRSGAKRLVYAPSNGQWFARDQAFAKGGPKWGNNQRNG